MLSGLLMERLYPMLVLGVVAPISGAALEST
jgi:hypothetical protein